MSHPLGRYPRRRRLSLVVFLDSVSEAISILVVLNPSPSRRASATISREARQRKSPKTKLKKGWREPALVLVQAYASTPDAALSVCAFSPRTHCANWEALQPKPWPFAFNHSKAAWRCACGTPQAANARMVANRQTRFELWLKPRSFAAFATSARTSGATNGAGAEAGAGFFSSGIIPFPIRLTGPRSAPILAYSRGNATKIFASFRPLLACHRGSRG